MMDSLSTLTTPMSHMALTSAKLNYSLHKPTNYKYLYVNLSRYFLTWYLPLVLVAGTIGGFFCLIFLIYSRMFPKTVLIWMICICIGDLLVLYTDTLRMAIKVLTNFDLRDTNAVVCKTHIFFSNYFFYWSAYMQTCMSLQRLYFIKCPLRARIVIKPRKVATAAIVVSILIFFPLLPYLIYWGIDEEGDCEPSDKNWYITTTILDFSIWGVVPLLSMTGSTFLISWTILRWSPNSPSPAATASSDNLSKNVSAVSSPTNSRLLKSATPTSKSIASSRHGQDNTGHVTRLLVIINGFYMFSTYPLLIYLMVLNFVLQNKIGETIPQAVHKFFYYLLRSICYLSSSFNWVFYCAAGNIFRQRAWRALRRFFCSSYANQEDSRVDMRQWRYTTSPTNFQTTTTTQRLSSIEAKRGLFSKGDSGKPLYRHSLRHSHQSAESGAWGTPRAHTLHVETVEEEDSGLSSNESAGKEDMKNMLNELPEEDASQLEVSQPKLSQSSSLATRFKVSDQIKNFGRKHLSYQHQKKKNDSLDRAEEDANRPKSSIT